MTPTTISEAQEIAAWADEVDAYKCSVCLGWIDPIESSKREVAGRDVCSDCADACPWCGEFIDDETTTTDGPAVRVREWANDGRVGAPTHAMCAANDHLSDVICKFDHIDLCDATREEIDAMVAQYAITAMV